MQKYNFNTISDACVKCGKCKPNCTIFKISGDETKSPRGFLDLLGAYSRGELKLDKNTKDIFESCFLCTNCVSECPNSLATDTMIENVRHDIADKFGIA
ncbi:MAG: 4Fe-4S dicluster domain-containing protein, partial [Campylobacter hyointestinalis]